MVVRLNTGPCPAIGGPPLPPPRRGTVGAARLGRCGWVPALSGAGMVGAGSQAGHCTGHSTDSEAAVTAAQQLTSALARPPAEAECCTVSSDRLVTWAGRVAVTRGGDVITMITRS